MNYAPIALFTYNRLIHTQKTIEALLKNDLAKESKLYVFSDGAKSCNDGESVEEIRDYLKTVSGFKEIHIACNEHNKGLAHSIIDGVTSLFKKYETVIIMEDDLQTSPYFLQFMNDALTHYSPDKTWSIAGYSPKINIPESYMYNTYLAHRNCSWGWATWKQNWVKTDWEVTRFNDFFADKKERVKFERGGNDLSIMLLKQNQGLIDSWSVRFNFSAYTHHLPTVYPVHSLIKNSGADGSGTNMKKSSKYDSSLYVHPLSMDIFCPNNHFNAQIESNFKRFYNTSIYRRIINAFKTLIALYGIKKPR